MATVNIELPQYVHPRGPSFRYRRIIPQDCQKAIGQKVWVRTWKKGTSIERIRTEAATQSRQHDRLISEARGLVASPAVISDAETLGRELLAGDPARLHDLMSFLHEHSFDGKLGIAEVALENVVRNQGVYRSETIKLSVAVDQDQERHGHLRAERPVRDAVRDFMAVVGDIDVTAITEAHVMDWIALRLKMQAPGTVKRRLATLAAMMRRIYKGLAYKGDNPFDGHRIKASQKRTGRNPLNKAMFAMLDRYLAESNRLDGQTRNMINIARNTTLGPKEIAGLVVSDLSLDSEIPHIIIRANAVRGLKNANREREIPLVGVALDATRDALDAALARNDGTGPDSTPIFLGYCSDRGADIVGAKMTKAIRDAGVPVSPRLVAYSLRHSLKQALRVSGCRDHVQHDLMGHSSRGVSDDYGSVASLTEKRDALVAALPRLGEVDDSIYCEAERV